MKVIFDLDGTLANAERRVHHITGEAKDWRSFYAECDKDEPVAPIVAMLHALIKQGHDCEIWSGRSMEVASETLAWLMRHGIDFGDVPLRMRMVGDHRPDTELKARWLSEARSKPDLVFEDRSSVVEMWRSHGIICAQVAPGNF